MEDLTWWKAFVLLAMGIIIGIMILGIFWQYRLQNLCKEKILTDYQILLFCDRGYLKENFCNNFMRKRIKIGEQKDHILAANDCKIKT